MKIFNRVVLRKNTKVSITQTKGAVIEGVLYKTFREKDEWITIVPNDSEAGEWIKCNMLYVNAITIYL